MRDRELILMHLERILERYPSMRVGQIIENARRSSADLYYRTDADLEEELRIYLADSHIR